MPESSVREYAAEVLFRPESDALRFLPEGPVACGDDQLAWVAIQHGAEATTGSLNVLDLDSGSNRSYPLPGRPGFAYPLDDSGSFVVGLERALQRFDPASGGLTELVGGIDADVAGTIVNDGLLFSEGIVFGCKDLEFRERKAGLYLWRTVDQRLFQLRDDQICSNGKVIRQIDGRCELLDIDSPSKTIVAYDLDVDAGRLGSPRIVVDLRDGEVFPDGMVASPDGTGVIVAIYNPHDADYGEARQYRLSDGSLETIWKTPGSPQVTCPQVISINGVRRLVLTTAVEHMPAERQARHPNAGCLFIASDGLD